MRVHLAWPIAAVALAVAACGSDDRATSTPTPTARPGASSERARYLQEANAICAKAQRRLDAIPRPSSLSQVPAVATREIAIRREVIAGLSQLAPPQKLASSATGVIRNLNAQQARARAVKRAAEHNDGAKLSGIEDRGATSLEREAIEADDLGLSDCAQI